LATAPETGGGWSASPDGGAVAYTASAPLTPACLYRQKLDGDFEMIEIPDLEPMQHWRLAAAEDATFIGPDGDTIEAWWYRSSNSTAATAHEPASVPLIVYYYGGSSPTTRGFNATHQFWAAHGYAVLVINPRGATGYGDEFADVHAGDWGPAAGADIVAGTRALLESQPQLDAERVGCYGGSYGGFMTMHLVAHSDVFAAAVAMYGISDLATYWGQGAWCWTYGDMANAGRTPWGDAEFFLGRSPLFAADQVRTPLLLLHGEADANVTPGESVQMFTALQTLGRDVEMVTFPGEDHGIAGTFANYVLHRTMMLEWFDRWLRGRPEAWEHRWER
jgi:dipeptidyl aminopeptidase/acylaminoacyl peptidase